MANFMQIIEINKQGGKSVFHPETDADYVLPGRTAKVPTIVNIEDWIARSKELVEARKGSITLRAKIDSIDNALLPSSLLESIKKVDGSGSGLDADLVDGRTVNDAGTTSSDLWTANKVKIELDKKLNADQVTAIAEPNKILRLNAAGALETSITKNAATATRLQAPLSVKLDGDVVGQFSFVGNEKEVNMTVEVLDNSHNHSALNSTTVPVSIRATSGERIANFSIGGTVKSYIDENGVYNGDCTSINGFKINDDAEEGRTLWSAGRIIREVNSSVETTVSSALENYSTTENGAYQIGPFKMYKGTVDIYGKSTIDLELPTLTEVVSESYVINSTNAGISYVKSPGTNTILINRPPEEGATLSWYIMGI